ncbi:copper chaperone PCu(A)C [Asaia bogorensis]|uniref:copper chaperone PCu(A)C n=1 Tax=Asaia bogorensis TaxID=91915 RepID=UPI0013C40714|nr:copper chaperone PCu(A)C [Asaia bogorensis]
MKRVQAIPALLMTVCVTGALLFPVGAQAQTDDTNIPGQKNANRDITIEGWIRRARHYPGLAAAYFTVVNKGHEAHLISGVTSPDCAAIEAFHSEQEVTSHTANLFSHFTIPAEMTMVFPEGGYHLICRNFPDTIKTGETVPLTFKFLGGTSTTVNFMLKD